MSRELWERYQQYLCVVDSIGLSLDVSRMKSMTVDAERRVAWARPGLTWGEYATHAHAFGLSTPAEVELATQ